MRSFSFAENNPFQFVSSTANTLAVIRISTWIHCDNASRPHHWRQRWQRRLSTAHHRNLYQCIRSIPVSAHRIQPHLIPIRALRLRCCCWMCLIHFGKWIWLILFFIYYYKRIIQNVYSVILMVMFFFFFVFSIELQLITRYLTFIFVSID